MSAAFSLSGQRALITGGGSGIGLAIAKAFLEAGAEVVLAGRRKAVLEMAAAELGPGSDYRVLDVTHPDECREIVSEIAPSILVNNAGIHLKKPAIEVSDDEFSSLWQTHVAGGFTLSKAAYPIMASRGGGSILFISSMAALFGIPSVAAYSSAKHALTGLVHSLAVEWGAKGIRVNAIAPGWIATDMTRKAFEGDPARKEKIIRRTALGRLGEPADIGHAAVYLSSDAAKFVTGTVFPVDGGASIGF